MALREELLVVRLTRAEHREIRLLARAERTTKSELVRELVRTHAEKLGRSGP